MEVEPIFVRSMALNPMPELLSGVLGMKRFELHYPDEEAWNRVLSCPVVRKHDFSASLVPSVNDAVAAAWTRSLRIAFPGCEALFATSLVILCHGRIEERISMSAEDAHLFLRCISSEECIVRLHSMFTIPGWEKPYVGAYESRILVRRIRKEEKCGIIDECVVTGSGVVDTLGLLLAYEADTNADMSYLTKRRVGAGFAEIAGALSASGMDEESAVPIG